ncbi:MAG: (2Fe-2S)-binding protein [Pseudomonadota bacterium]
MIEFTLNGEVVKTDDEPDTPLLWVVRDTFKLKGSKFGCGMAQCGACTMQIDGNALRTCVLPVAAVAGKSVTTIEGVGTAEKLHAVQQAWIEEQVPQCGYCQSGQIVSAVALLERNSNPTDADIDAAMAGNICRCGMYSRIKKGVKRAAESLQEIVVEEA